jgi:septation ring formation regulator EzrA
METLKNLSWIYAAVLVLALAVSLIAILVYLWRIASSLGKARAALEVVRDETALLSEPLEELRDASGGAAEELSRARESLARADDRLEALLERLGVSLGR